MLTVPTLTLRAATEHRLPAGCDSNSPYPGGAIASSSSCLRDIRSAVKERVSTAHA